MHDFEVVADEDLERQLGCHELVVGEFVEERCRRCGGRRRPVLVDADAVELLELRVIFVFGVDY